jgi:hypothetical protein
MRACGVTANPVLRTLSLTPARDAIRHGTDLVIGGLPIPLGAVVLVIARAAPWLKELRDVESHAL